MRNTPTPWLWERAGKLCTVESVYQNLGLLGAWFLPVYLSACELRWNPWYLVCTVRQVNTVYNDMATHTHTHTIYELSGVEKDIWFYVHVCAMPNSCIGRCFVYVITWIRVQFMPVVSAIIPKLYKNPCDCIIIIYLPRFNTGTALCKKGSKPRLKRASWMVSLR